MTLGMDKIVGSSCCYRADKGNRRTINECHNQNGEEQGQTQPQGGHLIECWWVRILNLGLR